MFVWNESTWQKKSTALTTTEFSMVLVFKWLLGWSVLKQSVSVCEVESFLADEQVLENMVKMWYLTIGLKSAVQDSIGEFWL